MRYRNAIFLGLYSMRYCIRYSIRCNIACDKKIIASVKTRIQMPALRELSAAVDPRLKELPVTESTFWDIFPPRAFKFLAQSSAPLAQLGSILKLEYY